MTRLSIVIPIHNSESDLEKCLNSIIPQLSHDDELLLIVDSSTDKSWEICQNYVKEYEFIQAYSVNFRGPSPTRNYGIKKSKGQYILFIDSDDWIENNYITEMMEQIEDSDLTVCGYYLENNEEVVKKELKNYKGKISKNDVFHLYENELLNVLWNKIFKGEIIRDHHILFDEKIKKGEDLLFILNYLKYVNKDIYYVNSCLYHYISKETGVSKSHQESMEAKLDRTREMYNVFCEITPQNERMVLNVLNLYFRQMRDFLSFSNYSVFKKLSFISKYSKQNFVKDVLNHTMTFRILILKLLYNLRLFVPLFLLNRVYLCQNKEMEISR